MGGPAASAVVFGAGAAGSLGASVVLVRALEGLGDRFGLSESALGLLAALGACSPEVASAAAALASGQRGVGLGIVAGSNVFNLAALLGLAALVCGRVGLHRRVVALEGSVAAWVALVALVVVVGALPGAAGLGACLAGVLAYLAVVAAPGRVAGLPLPGPWRRFLVAAVSEARAELAPAVRPPRPGAHGPVAALAATAVVVASVAMERAATDLGRRLGLGELVVGAVVLAAVTSLPNAVAAVYLATRARAAATLSEAMNSNTVNTLAGLLVPGALAGVAGPLPHAWLLGGWYAGMTAATLALVAAGRGLGRLGASAVVVAYLAFVAQLAAS
ncbi:MAG TPA: hypothetical protein VKY15_01730 [Acidimicrobiales bacterium]|nr:hypothetical protein [Acidimicrobiales bacterium]